ncbi:hypothetical protein J6590_047271 [Homalodisca vitripennis]|nr:hypothetical protein J6590_047271 [Homalodisca vitripennis]
MLPPPEASARSFYISRLVTANCCNYCFLRVGFIHSRSRKLRQDVAIRARTQRCASSGKWRRLLNGNYGAARLADCSYIMEKCSRKKKGESIVDYKYCGPGSSRKRHADGQAVMVRWFHFIIMYLAASSFVPWLASLLPPSLSLLRVQLWIAFPPISLISQPTAQFRSYVKLAAPINQNTPKTSGINVCRLFPNITGYKKIQSAYSVPAYKSASVDYA